MADQEKVQFVAGEIMERVEAGQTDLNLESTTEKALESGMDITLDGVKDAVKEIATQMADADAISTQELDAVAGGLNGGSFDLKMLQLQQRNSRYNQMCNLLSSMLKGHHDAQKNIIQNM